MTTKNMTATIELANHPVGMQEIARLLSVSHTTVVKWKERGILPPPADGWIVSGRPAWRELDILAWAYVTNRIELPTLVDPKCIGCATRGVREHRKGCDTISTIREALDAKTTAK